MRSIDSRVEESIRRWPVWFARLSNFVIRWTEMYCAAGCGYPITSRFSVDIEEYGDTRIIASICSLGGDCEHEARIDVRDDAGRSYADFRPDIIHQLKTAEEPVPVVRLSLTR